MVFRSYIPNQQSSINITILVLAEAVFMIESFSIRLGLPCHALELVSILILYDTLYMMYLRDNPIIFVLAILIIYLFIYLFILAQCVLLPIY